MASDLLRLGAPTATLRPSLPRPWVVHFVVFLSTTLITMHPLGAVANDPESAATIIVNPSRLYIEFQTESNEVSCTYASSDANMAVVDGYVWLDPNEQPLNTSSDSRIFYNSTSGTLTLNKAQTNDSGEYTCMAIVHDANGTCSWTEWTDCVNGTLTYKVYVMPDYTTDGIIIGVINGVLLIIFVACLIRSAIADRRRLRKYGRKI